MTSRTGLGVGLAICATICFATLDTLSQRVSALVPVFMAMWLRFVVQTAMTAALLWPTQRQRLWVTRAPGWQLLRGLLMVCSGCLAYLSLRYVPVGEFTAIMCLVPLVITLLAAVWLREKVARQTWWLIAGGLLGALVVVRPVNSQWGLDFHGGQLLPLLLVVINALYQIVTGRMVRTEDPGTTHFYTGLVGLALTTALLPWVWVPLADPWLWEQVALLGVFGSLGHYLLIKAYTHAPASVVTPYLYAQVGFATFGGWLAFGHAPDMWSVTGIVLIAACGLVGVRR